MAAPARSSASCRRRSARRRSGRRWSWCRRRGPAGFFGPAQARLADGVSLETASAEVNTLGLQLRGIEAEPGAEPRFEVVRSLDELTAAVAPALRVLVVAVGVVLAIVCINVANLLLVRGTRRQQEIAIRRSLGATRGRITRQVLTESLVLAGFAGLVGDRDRVRGREPAQAHGDVVRRARALRSRASVLPRLDEIAIDPPVLAFVVALSVVTGVLFGLLPALRLSKYGEHGHASQSQLSTLARNSRLGHVLATVQLACAMALLIGAGLLVNSFMKLTGIDPGFDPTRRLELRARRARRFHGGAQARGCGDARGAPRGRFARDERRLRGHTAVDTGYHAHPGSLRFRKARRRPRCMEEQRTQTAGRTRADAPGEPRLSARLGCAARRGRLARRADETQVPPCS